MIKRFTKPSDIILQFCAKFNLSQKELAKKIGVSDSMVNHLINNRYPVTPRIAIELERVFRFGISAKKILTYQAHFQIEEEINKKRQ